MSTVALRLDTGTFKITEKRLGEIVIFLYFFFTALDLGKVMVETEVDRNVLELLFMSGCINFLSYGVLFPMILPTYLPNYFKENFRFTLST